MATPYDSKPARAAESLPATRKESAAPARASAAASRHIIILISPASEPRTLAQGLTAQGFRPISITDEHAALAVIQQYQKLCLAVVCEQAVSSPAESFIGLVREYQPTLPLVWLGAAPPWTGPDPLGSRANELVLPPGTNPPALARAAQGLLRGHFYPTRLVAELLRASHAALRGFEINVTPRGAFLRSSKAQLSETNTVLSFSGTSTAGHLVVSCSVGLARKVAEGLFGVCLDEELRKDQMADVVGELCNRTIGRLQPFFDQRGTPIDFGIPIFVHKGRGEIWNGAGMTSLCLEFETPEGALFVELSLAELEDERPMNSCSEPDPHAEQECLFL